MKNWLLGFVGGDGTGKSTQIHLLIQWLLQEGYRAKTSREPGGSKRGEVIRAVLMNARLGGFNPEQQNVVNLDFMRMADMIGASGSRYHDVAERVLTLGRRSVITPDLEIALFILARIIHFEEEIRPYMEGRTPDDVFVLDRFWPCTFAYQIHTRLKNCDDEELIRFMNDIFDWHVEYLDSLGVHPEFVLLDVDLDVGLSRLGMRVDEITDFDTLGRPFHESVREGYRLWHGQCSPSHPYVRFRASSHLVDATPPAAEVFEQVKRIMRLRMDGTSSSGGAAAVA